MSQNMKKISAQSGVVKIIRAMMRRKKGTTKRITSSLQEIAMSKNIGKHYHP